ncbi:hypothetical protein D3C81_194360 [compost metagenome]
MSTNNPKHTISPGLQFFRRLRDPEADDLTPSAMCKLDGCNRPLYRIPGNARWRLCQEHYEARLLKQQKKQQPPEPLYCKNCGHEITNPRNTTYCCRECADTHRRIIDDAHTVSVLSHSWWGKIETLFQRSPFGPDSAPSPLTDIPGLWKLHALKASYQKSFNVIEGEWLIDPATNRPVEKLTASIRLELCHRYPNARGGANTPRNIVLAPGFTNRPLQSRRPPQNTDERFNAVQAGTGSYPMTQSLIAELKARYGEESVCLMMQKIKPSFSGRLKAYSHRKPGYATLFSIMVLECKRLGFASLGTQLDTLYRLAADALGLHLESLASAFFIALQTQDADGLMATTERLVLDERCRLTEKPADLNLLNRNLRLPLYIYEGSPVHTLLFTADTVLQKYLHVDIFESIQTRFLKLYNSAFYQPPVLAYSPLEFVPLSSPHHKEHPEHDQWVKNTRRKGQATKRQNQRLHQAISNEVKKQQTRPT